MVRGCVAQAKQLRQHNSLFLVACARGLVQDAQQLMEWGAQPGAADKQGLTSAHFAAAHGKADLLAFLWSKGVELDAEDPGTGSQPFAHHPTSMFRNLPQPLAAYLATLLSTSTALTCSLAHSMHA